MKGHDQLYLMTEASNVKIKWPATHIITKLTYLTQNGNV